MSEIDGEYWYDPDNRELVIKTDEEESRFYFQDRFELKGETYCILSPAEEANDEIEANKEENNSEEEALIMKVIEDEENDEEILSVIDDDEEFEAVCRHYYREEQ